MKHVKKEVQRYLDILNTTLNINCSIYDPSFELLYTNDTELGQKILANSNALEEIRKDENKYPIIIGSKIAIMWFMVKDNINNLYYVFGPFSTSSLNERVINQYANKYNLSIALKNQILQHLEQLPISTYNSLFPYCIIMHYLINDEKIKTEDIEILTISSNDDEIYSSQRNDRIRTWKTEMMLMKNIEEGNIDFKSSLDKAKQISYGIQLDSTDAISQMKYSVLTFIAISVRAAIRGGLTPELAYSLGDAYIDRLDKCDSLGSFTDVANEMFSRFVTEVHNIKQNNNYSETIRNCIDYINLRVEENINLNDLAEYTGYAVYYLSKKFKKETNLSIKQYINNKKIERAKLYLETSDLLIKEISDKLCFESETYFSTVFDKIVGISPIQYRKNLTK